MTGRRSGDHSVTTEASSTVTTGAATRCEQGLRGTPPGIRTRNLRIKSPLLCR
jgi:hypothetical protein